MVLIGIFLVIALSAYLRLLGITWGLKSGYGHYLNFQPDEFISLRGMLPIQLLEGKLKAPEAYFEGTFNYYIWSVPEVLYRLWTGAPALKENAFPLDRFEFLLLSGRLITVAFDLVTLLIIYVVVVELTKNPIAGLMGAFVYGILPMQVIYSHFMRTHVLSNLLCALVIWLSLKAIRKRRSWLYFLAGVVSGLGGATRYPVAVIFCIPFLLVLFAPSHEPLTTYRRLRKVAVQLLLGPFWFLLSGFVVGLFLGSPMLFLDPLGVLHTIRTETLHYVPNGALKLYNLQPLWEYFSVLIPYAAYPLLWILLYLATLGVLFRRSLWYVALPLCLFGLLYAYPMSKGYIVIFARQVMLLLPVFCIFVGLAFDEILPTLTNGRRMLVASVLGAIIIIPSVLFDWAYDRAMRRQDVRTELQADLRELVRSKTKITIGVSESGGYFYTVMPGAFPLNGGHVRVELQKSPSVQTDYFVMGFERSLSPNWRDYAIKNVEKSGDFRLVKVYNRGPMLFGRRLNLSEFPPDMTYPFPTILLFRKTAD